MGVMSPDRTVFALISNGFQSFKPFNIRGNNHRIIRMVNNKAWLCGVWFF